MKRLALKEILALSIFFLVVISAGLIVRPLFKLVSVALNKSVEGFCQTLEENAGMSVSYEKLSPSIVAGLKIKNIKLSDSRNGKNIIVLKKIIVRYNLLDFIKGKGFDSVKDITVDGLFFNLNSNNDNLLKLLKRKKSNEDESQRNFLNLENFASSLPFNTYVRNVHIILSDDNKSCDVNFKKISLAYLARSKLLQVKTSGGVAAFLGKEKIKFLFSASGSVTNDFEGSQLSLRMADFTNGNLTLNRLNLLLAYRERAFELRTIQNGYPLFLQGTYNVDTADARLSLKTQNLKPGNTLTFRKNEDIFRKIKNLALNIEASADYNFQTGLFSYKSDGNVYVPDAMYKGAFTGSYSLKGDSEKIVINFFDLQGENIDVEYNGSCFYKGLKVSGNLMINNFLMKNGGILSTEVYFDPLNNGFMAFAPQLMMNEKALTALQLTVIPVKDSVDFSFEVSDYSHLEAEKAGNVKINGSYIGGTKYIQANISSDGLYLDSAAQTAAFFSKKASSSTFNFLSDYIFNGEFFFSTDLKDFSCNIPYAFVANTKHEGQFVFISLDGNSSSFNLTRLDFITGGKLLHFSGLYEKSPDENDSFFMIDVNADSIPYHFTGNIMPELVSMNGDYGLLLDFKKNKKNGFSGSFSVDGLPVGALGSIFTLSADTSFKYSQTDGIDVKINRFEAVEASGKYFFNPSLSLAGNISKYGLFFNSISYSDKFSTIEGFSELLWNINSSVFDSASLNIALKNPLSSEAVNVSLDLSNPNGEALNLENFKKSFYLNSKIVFNNFGLNRFTAEQSDNNLLSATLIASGLPENPYVGLNLDELSLMTAGKTVKLKGSAFIEEKNLTVENSKLTYNNINVKDIKAAFDLTTFTGSASASLDTVVAKQTLHAPLVFSVSDTVPAQGHIFPEQFAARFACEKLSGTLMKKEIPFELTMLHADKVTSIFSSEEQGISGTVSDDGKINFSVAEGKPVQFKLTGDLKGQQVNIALRSFSADLGKLYEFVDIPRIKIFNGLLKGSVQVTGLKSDPEFLGSFALSNADFILPKIVTQHVYIPKALMVFNHNELQLPEAHGFVKKDIPVNASMSVFFDRWSFNRLEARIWNPDKVYMPGDFEIRLARFTGDVNLDLNLIFEDHYLDVNGDLYLKKLTGSVKTRELAFSAPKRNWYARTDLNIHFGQHVTFIFDPLLRAVLVPNTDFGFKYDMSEGAVELDGELAFRSGDISYLSRNFYLKNGSMRFNSNDPTFNPLISIQAETRERDDDGNDVRILLTANNQYLLNFNAQFSSIPAKSETEIRALLGQIALGDSDKVSSLLLATGDYAIQSTIGRSIENKLRDFLNFDILSVRTNVLQNALSYGFLERAEDEEKSVGLGNFFDNSTVYIGKYFGSSLYMDALMHWSYDETRVDDELTPGGLVFRPEFGLEIEAPFGNLRWNMAPDINGIRNDRFVSSTSVTLSWKFSF